MIKFSLICAERHEFEAWFANSSAFDSQAKARQLFCPVCGIDRVEKALMAPNILSGQNSQLVAKPSAEDGGKGEILTLMRKLRDLVEQNSEYVGPRFAEEALKIHHEEQDARSIYGEASQREINHLREEGVEFYPLPTLPEDQN